MTGSKDFRLDIEPGTMFKGLPGLQPIWQGITGGPAFNIVQREGLWLLIASVKTPQFNKHGIWSLFITPCNSVGWIFRSDTVNTCFTKVV